MTQPVPHTQPLIIGITGTIGSGKSLVGTILKEEGVPVVDTDAVVHLLLDNDPGVQANIEKRFGTTVLKVDELGKTVVDRRALGHVVFNDDIARRDLERIVHPAVLEYCQDWIASQGEPLVALLVPLLFEAGLPRHYDQIWSVVCDEPILRSRLKARNNFSDDEIDKRLQAQLSQKDKAERADRIIDNSASIENTRQQVLQLIEECKVGMHRI